MTAHALPRSAAEATIVKQFEALKAPPVSPRRAAAFERFAASGLPTRRVEFLALHGPASGHDRCGAACAFT